ncbi:MAG: ketoacyl-ACP synthase III family protein [Frankia sp.]
MAQNLYISGTGTFLPGRITLEEADRAGLCKRSLVWNTGIVSVCVADEESAPEMAVRAALTALERAGREPQQISLVLHASAYYQGHDMWTPASYIQHHAVGNRCPAMEVRQMSNGGMAALELSWAYLAADPRRTAALITTADRFARPGFDRWHSDPGTVCGDGGTALVVSTTAGWARVSGIASVSDPGLERGGRGDDPFSLAPLATRSPIDLNGSSASLVREIGLEAMLRRIEAGQREVFERACADAGVKFSEIDWFVLPNMGRTRMKAQFFGPFDIKPERTTWAWGREVGHLGAGDQVAGLQHLIDNKHLEPGQTCMLVGVGAGFSWTAAVIEVLESPEPTCCLPRH